MTAVNFYFDKKNLIVSTDSLQYLSETGNFNRCHKIIVLVPKNEKEIIVTCRCNEASIYNKWIDELTRLCLLDIDISPIEMFRQAIQELENIFNEICILYNFYYDCGFKCYVVNVSNGTAFGRHIDFGSYLNGDGPSEQDFDLDDPDSVKKFFKNVVINQKQKDDAIRFSSRRKIGSIVILLQLKYDLEDNGIMIMDEVIHDFGDSYDKYSIDTSHEVKGVLLLVHEEVKQKLTADSSS